LSKAGKEVLLKAVIQAIPMCILQCFEFPRTLCDDLESLCRKVWWAQNVENKCLAWMACDKLCEPKRGGLGFWKFHHFNTAMLAKQCWRLVTDEESLVSCTLEARYFPCTSFCEVKIDFQPSYVWRSTLKAREVLEMGCQWNIGDGNKVKIWGSKWVPWKNASKVITIPCLLGPDAYVCDLIKPVESQWRIKLV